MLSQTRFYYCKLSYIKVLFAASLRNVLDSVAPLHTSTSFTSEKFKQVTAISDQKHMNVDRDTSLNYCIQISANKKFNYTIQEITFYFINENRYIFIIGLEQCIKQSECFCFMFNTT